jgi:hypothetical protein
MTFTEGLGITSFLAIPQLPRLYTPILQPPNSPFHCPPFIMQAHQHLPLRGNSIQDIISSIRPNRVIYLRENADSPICPPPCECVDCQNQFYMTEEQKQDRFSYKTQVSDVEVREILKDYISRIRNDREFLQKQCEVYGDRILSRWKKKSQEQRAACLLHAEPDLYPHQWFIPRYTNTSPCWKDARKYRKSFLLPYLSVELLKTNPVVFFDLLHNRTLYPLEIGFHLTIKS